MRDRVLHLRIDRVERRNAFTQDMYRAIKRAAVWADEQPELDAVCLTGTDRWFGAGGDMAGRASDPEGLALEWDPTDQFPFRHIERCSKVWIARINGLCHAGGLVLTVHCDVTIASDQARFRAPELLRGIPDPFLTARLPALVGVAKARYLLFSAREISAAEADAMGLVGAVVPHDELDAAVDEVIGQIALDRPGRPGRGEAGPQPAPAAVRRAAVLPGHPVARDGRGHGRVRREATAGVATRVSGATTVTRHVGREVLRLAQDRVGHSALPRRLDDVRAVRPGAVDGPVRHLGPPARLDERDHRSGAAGVGRAPTCPRRCSSSSRPARR